MRACGILYTIAAVGTISPMQVRSVCGVILTSDHLEAMAEFYSLLLGLPLEREEHGGLDVHYGVDIGSVHFAIHPPADFGETSRGNSPAKIAFEVDDVQAYVDRLRGAGYEPWQDVHDEGFGPLASFRDPDGNLIELVELRYDFTAHAPVEPDQAPH